MPLASVSESRARASRPTLAAAPSQQAAGAAKRDAAATTMPGNLRYSTLHFLHDQSDRWAAWIREKPGAFKTPR